MGDSVSQQRTPAQGPSRQASQGSPARYQAPASAAMLALLNAVTTAPRGVLSATLAGSLQRNFGNQFVQRLVKRQQVTASQAVPALSAQEVLQRQVPDEEEESGYAAIPEADSAASSGYAALPEADSAASSGYAALPAAD